MDDGRAVHVREGFVRGPAAVAASDQATATAHEMLRQSAGRFFLVTFGETMDAVFNFQGAGEWWIARAALEHARRALDDHLERLDALEAEDGEEEA